MTSLFRAATTALVAALLWPTLAGAQPAQLSVQAAIIDWDALNAMARDRAQQAWQAGRDTLPADLAQLDYDGVRDIRFRPERSTWRDQSLPFEVQYFHLGLYQKQSVRIHEIHAGQVHPLPYRSDDYDFGRNRLRTQTWQDMGHAGFRVHFPLNSDAYKDELIVFLGASYFRALGAGQQYGLSARALAIDTVGGDAEEFPRFTDFWLERPTPGARELTILALLDSPRASGAYRFVIQPGKTTRMAVQSRIYLRTSARPVRTLGIAPLTSMYLFGENQPRADDFRPEVHDSDGLMVATGEGEWLWRPLQNPDHPSVSSFAMRQLNGFGLMQRDRQFTSYEDLEARYERRPSAWVRPIGDWGPGRVELLQLPTPDETHDNIVAYWVPERLPAAGQALTFDYELLWQGDDWQRPPGAWVSQSRAGHGYTRLDAAARQQQPQFVLDFNGPVLQTLPPQAAVQAMVSTNSNGRVIEAIAYPNPATGGWRMSLRIQRIDPAQPVEIRAYLRHGADAISETWSHLLLPSSAAH